MNESFPTTVAMKVFINDNLQLIEDIIDIVKHHFPKILDNDVSFARSSEKKYVAITFKIFAFSKEEIDKLYQVITKTPGVKMVL